MSAAAASPPPPAAAGEHRRFHLRGFLSPETCKVYTFFPSQPLRLNHLKSSPNHSFGAIGIAAQELEFVHRSCGTAGYRPSVLSTSLPHLAATGCGHLLLPFVPVRERLRDAVEAAFSCHFDLFIEFTGLISWCKRASIGWHSDDNKPYLRQRAFTAVCYLNDHGEDYKGGILQFQDGEPSFITPVAGDAVIYTADNSNTHCVDEVTEGERLTLTLWFTRDSAYDEDPKLLSFLSQTSLNYEPVHQSSYIPLPASDIMYWFAYDHSGFDIRCARVHILGFSFHTSIDEDNKSIAPAEDDPIELLGKPVRLGRGDGVFDKVFANGLHALQVVQFYYWKAPELAAKRKQTSGGSGTVCCPVRGTKLPLPCNHGLEQTIFGSHKNVEIDFEWSDFELAVSMWENYSEELQRKLLKFLPHWLSSGAIFVVSSFSPQVCTEGN
uniref:Fe2OG dioxygenase domain-containing protein n=1 Tax=Oryza punctata TaxID=4537 RepID=A0A0E0KB22_ORYPU